MSTPSAQDQELENVFRIMGLYIDNAKTYAQLSGGALLLTVAFAREVLGVQEGEPMPLDWSLVATWISFLVSTIAAATYQYFAVRFLEGRSGAPVHHKLDWPRFLRDNPYLVYALMMFSFYLGAVFFTVSAVRSASGT